jgi:uncharacterized damage-inducible protein DinB
MDRLAHYEYLVAARGPLFDRVRSLSAEQYRQRFPFGLGSVRRTLHHLAGAEWFLVGQIGGEPAGAYPFASEAVPDFPTLERLWRDLEPSTRRTLEAERDWEQPFEYEVTIPSRRRYRIRTTRTAVFTQFCYHEVHHRAQAMAMLRMLDAPVETIDFVWLTGQVSEQP